MPGLGHSKTGINLFEATANALMNYKAFQDKFIRRLLNMPRVGTPRSIIQIDSGMLLMKWRIAARKLQATNKIMTKDDDNINKRTLRNKIILRLWNFEPDLAGDN